MAIFELLEYIVNEVCRERGDLNSQSHTVSFTTNTHTYAPIQTDITVKFDNVPKN